MSALPYFLTASLYLVLFIGCYWLILRRNTFFGLNRAYLLGSVALSLTLPLLDLSAWWVAETRTAVSTITLPTFNATVTVKKTSPITEQGLWLLYGLGVLFMLGRLGFHLRAIGQLIGRGTRERRSAYTLVCLPDDGSPASQTPSFSFGRYLVLNSADARTEPDALMRHEAAHIRQYHTADVLFIELVRAAFWFNPVLWLYKRALQEVHEFLADRAASGSVVSVAQPDQTRPEYAQQLVAYALNVPATALTTPFVNMSTLKQRIIMLQKPTSHRRALLGYALVLPMAGLLTLCTQPDQNVTETERPITANQPARQAGVNGEIFTVVENQPEFPGGIEKLGAYLEKNLHYPAAAERANVQGRVFLNFIVTKDGDIADVKILKGIGFGADEEAVRVMKTMPRWKPGSQNGQPVNVRYNVPINFELNDQKLTEAELKNGKQSSLPAFPTNDADIQRQYKHFIVDGKEIPFAEFRKYPKDAITEVSSSEQTLRIQTTPPPPPPPVPANRTTQLDDVKLFTINGKKATKAEVEALSPNKIARVDVTKNKGQNMVAITTK